MKAHVLQHVPFEGPAAIGTWLEERGAAVRTTRLFAGDPLPRLEEVDFLVAMGGPMSVHDEAGHPWLAGEKRLVREAALAGVPLLGVCLGAQLLAAALGARVYRNPVQEIGWFPVRAVHADGAAFRFPETFEAFHWHGETFDLPEGAMLLARSEACGNQAFAWRDRAVGLQFHLETTPESARALVEHGRDELAPGPWVQTEEEILGAAPERCLAMRGVLHALLERLAGARGREEGAR